MHNAKKHTRLTNGNFVALCSFSIAGGLEEYLDVTIKRGSSFQEEELIALAKQCYTVDRLAYFISRLLPPMREFMAGRISVSPAFDESHLVCWSA